MDTYVGSLVRFIDLIFSLEDDGAFGKATSDVIIGHAQSIRQNSRSIRRDAQAVKRSELTRLTRLLRNLKNCGMIDKATAKQVISLAWHVRYEGFEIRRAGNSLEPVSAERKRKPTTSWSPQVPLSRKAPIEVLLDLGIDNRLYNRFKQKGYDIIDDLLKTAEVLMEVPYVGPGSISMLQQVLNSYGLSLPLE
jgi:hypothetical protein